MTPHAPLPLIEYGLAAACVAVIVALSFLLLRFGLSQYAKLADRVTSLEDRRAHLDAARLEVERDRVAADTRLAAALEELSKRLQAVESAVMQHHRSY